MENSPYTRKCLVHNSVRVVQVRVVQVMIVCINWRFLKMLLFFLILFSTNQNETFFDVSIVKSV